MVYHLSCYSFVNTFVLVPCFSHLDTKLHAYMHLLRSNLALFVIKLIRYKTYTKVQLDRLCTFIDKASFLLLIRNEVASSNLLFFRPYFLECLSI
jgi:hypothetical protein